MCRANYFALTPTTRPRRANVFAHKAQQHGDVETTNTTARSQQGTAETNDTSAPEKTAPKTPISHPQRYGGLTCHRYQRAKAMMVSDKRATRPTGSGCGARGRWRGLPSDQCRRYKRRQTNTIQIASRGPLLQTSIQAKTTIISEKALRLTTFVTTEQKSTLKTPWIDDVCNNTHRLPQKTQHARPP